MSVWILILVVAGGREYGLTIIDNIESREECVRLSKVIDETARLSSIRCIEVKKAK